MKDGSPAVALAAMPYVLGTTITTIHDKDRSESPHKPNTPPYQCVLPDTWAVAQPARIMNE